MLFLKTIIKIKDKIKITLSSNTNQCICMYTQPVLQIDCKEGSFFLYNIFDIIFSDTNISFVCLFLFTKIMGK